MKIIALGPIGYNRDVMNFVDGVIVMLSIMDLCTYLYLIYITFNSFGKHS